MDEELLEGAKSIIAGAFPIWRRLAPLSSSLEESFSRVPFFKGSDFSDLWKLSMTDSNDERAEAEPTEAQPGLDLLWDDEARGLCVRAYGNGSKSFK